MLTISRLESEKQPEQILYVLRDIHDAGRKIKFLYIGDGSMRDQLITQATDMGLSDYVFFAGNRPQEWIATVLPHAAVVLSPHMGRGLAEACLAGAPIVAYDYDWQKEIIISGKTGELVANGDWKQMAEKALAVLNDPASASLYGNNARTLSLEMMDPETANRNEIDSYENLLNV